MKRTIGVMQFFVNGGYIYVVDDTGNVWSFHVPDGEWQKVTSLPEVKL